MTPTIRPTKKQHLAWLALQDATTKYPVFGGGAGGGKSWVGCEWILTNCYHYPGSKWFIGRQELKRLMASTYITWIKVCSHHKIPREDWVLNGQYNYIEFVNGPAKGSRVDLLDLADKPGDPLFERFGSLEYTGGWIEEAGEIAFKAFDVLKSRIGRHLNDAFGIVGKVFITCNPKKNWLYQEVYKPWRDGKLAPEYAFIQSLYSDNPYTAKSYEKDLLLIKDRQTKERLMRGNWEYDDDPAILMEYDAIVDLFTNAVEEKIKRYMTVDAARFGKDKIVARLWRGLDNYKTYVWQKQGIDQTIIKLRDIAEKEYIPFSQIIVDEDGVGGGIVDGMRGIKGFVNNSTPIKTEPKNEQRKEGYAPPNYKNLKSQCYFLLADYVNDHKIRIGLDVIGQAPEDMRKELTEELEHIKRDNPDADEKKLAVEPKERLKEVLGRSPDHADSVMMRMWFELKPALTFSTVATTNLVLPFDDQLGV